MERGEVLVDGYHGKLHLFLGDGRMSGEKEDIAKSIALVMIDEVSQ